MYPTCFIIMVITGLHIISTVCYLLKKKRKNCDKGKTENGSTDKHCYAYVTNDC